MQESPSTQSEANDEATPDTEFPTAEQEWEQLTSQSDPLLSVQNLHTQFETDSGPVRAVDGISFEVGESEIVGLVGESGSGKSVTSLSTMGLVRPPGKVTDGTVLFRGENLTDMTQSELRRIRGNDISMIFQDPTSALNPVFDVGWQVAEPLRIHRDMSDSASRERAVELMRDIGIPSAEERIDDYPHEFSGGMRQRAMIAMALACEPDLLIADEPTTALDVTIESQILDLIQNLNQRLGMAVLLITHDLGVVAETCDRVAVMYAGRIVEYADVETIFKHPRHPYTQALLGCVPDPRLDEQEFTPVKGEIPDPHDLPDGCNFAPRCPLALEECTDVDPRLREVDDGHYSACVWEDPR